MTNSTHKCDFCNELAKYDGKTTLGPWAFMCEDHFKQYGINIKGLFTVLIPESLSTKVCVCCGLEKSLTDFYQYTDHSGITRYRNDCKTCNLLNKKKAQLRKSRKEKK